MSLFNGNGGRVGVGSVAVRGQHSKVPRGSRFGFLLKAKQKAICQTRGLSDRGLWRFMFTFFKKLEDKLDSKEAEKSQMQIKPKEKAKNDMNKLRQTLKARSNEDLCHVSEFSHNYVMKINSSRPPSPKLVRKPSPSVVQDASSRPPRRPSINTESSKNGLMKNSQITCSGDVIAKKTGMKMLPLEHEHGGSVADGCDR